MAAAPAVAYRPHRLALKRTRQAVLVWCFLAPSLAIFLLYRIIPLLWNLALSFADWSPLRPVRWAGYSQYDEMLHDDVFWQALWNTLLFIASAPLGIVMALGLALPQFSTIVCIFVFKASFDAVPRSLIDAARIDGLSEWRIIWKVMMPLAKGAIATNVILAFIWSWNNFLWPLIVTRSADMQTLPLGLARFLSYQEDTTGALYAFCIMVLAPGVLLFLLAQNEFIRGLTSGATKG